MNSRRIFIALSAYLFACVALTPRCFGNKNADIPKFDPPVQNYAVIDISGSQATSPVTMVALNDDNKATFGFKTGAAVPNVADYTSYQVYTWSKGLLSPLAPIDWVQKGQYDSLRRITHWTRSDPEWLTASGAVYANSFDVNLLDNGSPVYFYAGMFGCPNPPDPPYGTSSNGSPNNVYFNQIVSVTEKGYVSAGGRSDLPDGPEIRICWYHFIKDPDGNFTVFPDEEMLAYGYQEPRSVPGKVTVYPHTFGATKVNNRGQAVGGVSSSGTWAFWDRTTLNPISSIGQGSCWGLNDQGQAIFEDIVGDKLANYEGGFWESDQVTILRDKLPVWLQWQIQNIDPTSISNQVKAAPSATPVVPDPTTDTTIHILADAKSPEGSANGNTLWTRDNNGKWNFANIALPDGTTIDGWTSINSSGVIAAIGNGGHALLLFPLNLVEDTSDDSESNNFVTNAISPTPNAVTNKEGRAITKLAVGKMDNGTISDSGASATLNIDNDVDCFYVRISGAAGSGISSVKVSSLKKSDSGENDGPTIDGPVTLDLQADGSDLVTKSLLLTSDDVDDQVKVDNITNNAKNDRTLKVKLGGKFQVVSYQKDGKDVAVTDKLPIPIKKTVHCTPVIVRSFAGIPPDNTPDGVERELEVARERFAQVGIQLTWSTPTVVDPPKGTKLYNGLSIIDTVPPNGALGLALLSSDAKSVIANNGGCNNGYNIHLFWINSIHTGTNGFGELGGCAVGLFYFASSEQQYCNNCFLEAGNGPFVTAHELGHILTNAAHVEDRFNLMWGHDQSLTNTLTSHKRLNPDQATSMQGSSDAQ